MRELMQAQVLAGAIELIANQAVKLSVGGQEQLIALEQKSLAVHLTELSFPLCFTCHQQQLLVTSNTALADCTIESSIKTLRLIKENNSLTDLIKQDLLVIKGDIKVAQQFLAIAENMDIDWQTELAKHIGDIATYKLSQLLKLAGEKFTFAKQQISEDASEWLVHEKKLLVTNNECQQFNQTVDTTLQQVNNLAARIEQLATKFANRRKASEQL